MRSFVAVIFTVFIAVGASAQPALTPSTPALSPSSPALIPSSPALSVAPNVVVTNATLVSLSSLLLVLETNLQQTLPVLALFNDNFDFVSLGDNGLAPPRAGNFGANLGTNFAGNFAVNAAMPTGGSLVNSTAARVNPAAAGLPAGPANVPVSRDTLRALLVLQNDIQRMLPVLNSLNAGSASYPGSFTNLFGIVPGNP